MPSQATVFWTKVRQVEASLADHTHFIVDIKNGGDPVEAVKRNAAEHIARGAHRLATDTEIAVFREKQRTMRDYIRANEHRRTSKEDEIPRLLPSRQ